MSSGQLEDVVTNTKYGASPAWMVRAAGELGQRETDPYGRVSQYFEKCGATPDPQGTPWCRYFVDYCLRMEGWSTPQGGMARGLIAWGTEIDLSDAQVGDLVILWRGTHDDHVTGHVGFFIKQDAMHIYLLGGNQGDAVTEAKFLKSKVLSVRRPRSLWKSKTSWAGATSTLPGGGILADAIANAPTVEQAQEAKGILETVWQYFPNWKAMCGVAVIAIGLYIMYNKNNEKKEGK